MDNKEQEIEKILMSALMKAYNNGRANNKYIPEEVIPGLKAQIEQAGYPSITKEIKTTKVSKMFGAEIYEYKLVDKASDKEQPSTDREAWHDTIYMEVDAAFMSLLGNPMNMPKIRDITVESILGAIDSLLEPKVLSSREEREQTARESFGNH